MEFHVTLCGLLCCAIAFYFPLSIVVGYAVNYFFVKQDFWKEEANPHDLHIEVMWDDEAWPAIYFWSRIGVAIFYMVVALCLIICSCRRRGDREVTYVSIQN